MSVLRFPIYLIDGLLAIAAAAVIAILLTGGTVFRLGPYSISALHASNAEIFLLVVGFPRMVLASPVPLFGLAPLEPRRLSAKCLHGWSRFHRRMCDLDPTSARKLVLGLVVVSGLIKTLNAWHYYGFVSGDDVEIHEISFARLFSWADYQAWNLRNPFYPMTFIYPVQALALGAGFTSEATLVFAGRAVVILFSLATLVLVYMSARVYYRSIPVAVCSVAFLAGSKLHTTYASSELPRSVSAFFLVLAFWMLVREQRKAFDVVGSGLALGIGASLRFSEAISMLVGPVHLVWARRRLDAMALAFTSIATFAVIVAVSDLLFWGKPFFSLTNLIQFTLVDRLSTRGYQPFHYYLTAAPSWTNYLFLVLVAYAVRLGQFRLLLWVILPVCALSFLPHKEARYLVPVMPFLSMLAGFAAWSAIEKLSSGKGEERTRRLAALLATIVFGSFLFEADGMRFRRSESSVDIARYLRAREGVSAVAIQNLWTAGGRIYLWPIETVLEASPEGRLDPEFIEDLIERSNVQFVSLRAKDVEGSEWAQRFDRLGLEEVEVESSALHDRYRLFERRPPEPTPSSRR
jgi:hypothetical protein